MEEKFKEHLLFKPENLNLPHFILKPLGTGVSFVHKWMEFLRYLLDRAKVGVVIMEGWELLIPPPVATPIASSPLKVYYRPIAVPVASTANLNTTCSVVHTQFATQGDLSF